MRLTTEAQLAADMNLPTEKVAELRQTKKWPHVRLTRFDVRYTDEQIAHIVAEHSVSAPTPTPRVSGLTNRSARRAAS